MAFIPHADPTGLPYPLLAVGWTLNYEMFFYAQFALSLLIPGAGRRLCCLTAVLAGLVLAGMVVRPVTTGPRFLTDPVLLEFVGGMWLGYRARMGLPSRRWGYLALLGGALGLVASNIMLPTDLWGAGNWPWRAVVFAIPALALIAGGMMVERDGGVPISAWAIELGAASYSIYLLHTLVIAGSMRLFHGQAVAVQITASIALSVLLGVLFHRLIERPVTRLLQRAVAPRRSQSMPA